MTSTPPEPQYGQHPSHPAPQNTYQVGNYGINAANYSNYGQGLPNQLEKPEAPASITRACVISAIVWVASMVSGMLAVFYHNEIKASTYNSISLATSDNAGLSNDSLFSLAIVMFIISLVVTAGLLVCVYFMKQGHNWARIINTIFLAFEGLNILSIITLPLTQFGPQTIMAIIEIFGGALAIAAIVFSWTTTSNHYIRQSTVYRAWEKQQAVEK